jgi:hypothetical protein
VKPARWGVKASAATIHVAKLNKTIDRLTKEVGLSGICNFEGSLEMWVLLPIDVF